jgi:hypothetical protein
MWVEVAGLALHAGFEHCEGLIENHCGGYHLRIRLAQSTAPGPKVSKEPLQAAVRRIRDRASRAPLRQNYPIETGFKTIPPGGRVIHNRRRKELCGFPSSDRRITGSLS